jgi:hypothetical protein
MWINFSNNISISRKMDFLILFLLISTISISRISGDKHCSKIKPNKFYKKSIFFFALAERECASGLSEWCCPCK